LVVVVVGLSVPPWRVVLIPSALQSPPVPRKEPLPEELESFVEHGHKKNEETGQSQCQGGLSAPALEENGLRIACVKKHGHGHVVSSSSSVIPVLGVDSSMVSSMASSMISMV